MHLYSTLSVLIIDISHTNIPTLAERWFCVCVCVCVGGGGGGGGGGGAVLHCKENTCSWCTFGSSAYVTTTFQSENTFT